MHKFNISKYGVYSLILTTTLIMMACSPNPQQNNENKFLAGNLRALTPNERAEDFDQLLNLFKTYYGPYDFKEKLLKINIEKEHAKLKNLALQSKNDDEFLGYVQQFTALLKDGHVSTRSSISNTGNMSYSIPVWLIPVENKFLVEQVNDDFSKEYNVSIGDEILEVDNQAVSDYLPKILKYVSNATLESEKHAIISIFMRNSSMTDLVPISSSVSVKFAKEDGTILLKKIPWQIRKHNAQIDAARLKQPDASSFYAKRFEKFDLMKTEMLLNQKGKFFWGDVVPMYFNDKTKANYKFIEVKPSENQLKKAEYKNEKKPEVFSVMYKHQGKLILLVRLHTYMASGGLTDEDYVKYYKALLTEYQDVADVLVLDQTHNTGGSFCNQIYDLISKPSDVQTVYAMNADRESLTELLVTYPNWYNTEKMPLKANSSIEMGLIVEKAYDSHERLSVPVPLFTDNQPLAKNEDSIWKKPLLVLIDELAASCGDEFPMLVKANKRATLFGQPTMGMGGSVAKVGVLNNSQVSVSMTRGLFMPYNPHGNDTFADAIENRGVKPDISYEHTVADFRNGFMNYVNTFSDAALKEIK